MFVFDNSEDLDIATYEYRLYTFDQVDTDPVNAGYFILNDNVSINSGTITPYRQGFNLANVFTISVENSTTTSTTSTTSAVSYYGAIRAIDTSGNVGPWTLIEKTSTDTPLIDQQFIGSLTAAKITSGTIGAHEIILTQAGAPTSYTAPANVSVLRSSNYAAGSSGAGWLIRGDGFAEFDSTNIRGSISASSINLNAHNYWLPNSSNPIFKVGSNTKYFQWDGTDLTTTGNLITNATVTGGTVGGITVGSGATIDRFYIGTGTFNNANTAFYVDNTGQFSLKDKLNFNPTTSTLTITGAITATTLTATTSGNIGGWSIDSNSLYSGTKTASGSYTPSTGQMTIGSDGHISAKEFLVTSSGQIRAKTGTLGPFDFTVSGMNSIGYNPQNYMQIADYGDIYVYSAPVVGNGVHGGMTHTTALVGEYIVVGRTDLGTDRYVTMGSPQGQAGNVGFEIIENGSSRFKVYQDGNVSLYGTLNGYSFTSGRHNGANQMVHTDVNGYLQVGYINSSNGNEGNNSNPPRVWGTNGGDDYLRSYLTSALSVGSAGYATSAGSAATATTADSAAAYTGSSISTGHGTFQVVNGTNSNLRAARPYVNGESLLAFYDNTVASAAAGGIRWGTSATDLVVWDVASDIRLKNNVRDFDDALDIFREVRPVKFNWKSNDAESHGFIAQELMEVYPLAVLEPSVDNEYYGVSTLKMVPLMAAVIKKIISKIDELEARMV